MNLYIDADSLLYRSSHLANKVDKDLEEAEALEDDGEDIDLDDIPSSTEEVDTFIAMTKIFHSMANEIIKEVQAGYDIDRVYFVITVKKKLDCCNHLEDNFRYDVMESVEDPAVKGYKANRIGMEVPEGLDAIYEYVHALENTLCMSGVEADDVVVYYGRQGHIVAALDKDVLGSLDLAYNYGKKKWVANSKESIWRFPFYQTIMGDTSDGLRGVYRVGAKGAEKALAGLETEKDMWVEVIRQYLSKNQTVEEALATMRCVRMDQWTPEGGLVLWTPPKGRKHGNKD